MNFAPGTPKDLDMLLESVDAWAQERTAQAGHFTKGELHHFVRSLVAGGSTSETYKLAGDLLASLAGTEKMSRGCGYARVGVVQRAHTLSSLLEAAAGCVDLAHTPPVGRRGTVELRAITPGQLAGMRRAAALAAQMIAGDPERTAEVGGEHFAWMADGGEAGHGEWNLVTLVGAYSNETARARFHARHTAEQPSWHPEYNQASRKKYEQGIRNLLNLAATHGLIGRTAAPRGLLPSPAAEWAPDVRRLLGELRTGHRSHDEQCRSGLTLLARFASSRGYLTLAETAWAQVQADVSQAHADGKLRYSAFTRTRWVYRKLLDAELVQGPVWLKRGDDRVSLFALGEITEARRTRDFSGLRLPDGRFPAALCAGPSSLHSLLDWTTLAPSRLASAGLPPRAWPRATHEQEIAVRRNPDRFRLKPKSVTRLLDRLNQHAGFCARHRGVDFVQHGLEALCDPEHLTAYAAYRHRDHPVERDIEDGVLSALAGDLGWIASPFLEAQVLSLAAAARNEGCHGQGERLREQADRLQQYAAEHRLLAAEYRTRGKGGIRSTASDLDRLEPRDIQRIWEIWTADNVSGWHKLGRLRDLVIAEVETEAWRCLGRRGDGSVAVAEQLKIIAADQDRAPGERRFRPRKQWYLAVRNATILSVLCRVPLRAENLVELELAEWRNSSADGHAQRWEGAIHLEIPAAKMKSPRNYSPAYLRYSDLNDPSVLAMARPDVLKLYFALGGARDALLTLHNGSERMGLAPGTQVSSPYVFPAPIAHKHSTRFGVSNRDEWLQGGFQMSTYCLRDLFRTLLLAHADHLGIDIGALTRIHGGASPHVIRHLFGSHHCDSRRWTDALGPEQASKLLHHASVKVTLDRYCGISERHISVTSDLYRAPVPGPAAARPASAAETAATLVGQFEAGLIDRHAVLREIASMLNSHAA